MQPVQDFTHSNDPVHSLFQLILIIIVLRVGNGSALLTPKLAVQEVLPRHLVRWINLVG